MRRATGRWLFVALLACAGVPGCGGHGGQPRNLAIKNNSGNVTIDGGRLSVNGRSYGAVRDGDDISIDGDTVKVNGAVRAPADK
jgi:hypothetical protein